MHYYHAGKGEPVILIHGFPETAYEWRSQLPALGERFEVFAIDTRGHGKTEKPKTGYTRADLAQDIVNFMDALHLETARVVAHDWGGIIAVKLVLDHGQRISRLALMDTICTGWPVSTNYYFWFQSPGLAEQFFPRYGQQFIEMLIGGSANLPPEPESPWSKMSTVVKPWASAVDIDHYASETLNPDVQAADCRYYRALPFHRVIPDPAAPNGERYERVTPQEMSRQWLAGERRGEYLDYGVEDRHKQYPKPTLWIYSDRHTARPGTTIQPDGTLSGDPAWDSFRRHFPDLKAISACSGHFMAEEIPDWTNTRLLEFLG